MVRERRVVIVGAGVSGLVLAAKLRAAGVPVRLLEKADEVGGTWRENRYPGVRCDVPSRLYQISFARRPDWSERFARGAEIQDYLVEVAHRLGVHELVRFGSEVTTCRWEDDGWTVECADGHRERADYLVGATGILHHPHHPAIEGLDRFAGRTVHTARWDPDLDLTGLRVAVVGTGSTGTQVVSETAYVAARLTVFQRTPQWLIPMPNASYSEGTRRRHVRWPALDAWTHRAYGRWLEHTLGAAVVRGGWRHALVTALVKAHLRWAVRDPALRRRLTPQDKPMCRRLVMSTSYYRAVQQPQVELVTERITRVEPEGVRTADGVLHGADVLVLATGFQPHRYLAPIKVVGPDGIGLDEVWAGTPFAHKSVAVPGFPAFFLLVGPHSPVGNHSVISVAETQADYVLRRITSPLDDRLESPRASATAHYNEEVRAALSGSIWSSGCVGWYLGADGVPDLYPWSAAHFRALLAADDTEDWHTRP